MEKIKKIFKFIPALIKSKKLNIMNSEDTIKYIIDNKCSVSRFGDGELSIMLGGKIGFQNQNTELGKKLTGIKSKDKLLVCLPYPIKVDGRKKLVKKARKFWIRHIFGYLGDWCKFFSANIYGDTNFTRFYIDLLKKDKISGYVLQLKKIWDKRDVVFIEGENTKLGIGNDLFDNTKSIKRIICPSKNAFVKYDSILEYVKDKINKNDLIMIALGPTATIMASDLSDFGFQALDIGHVDIEYEWFKMGVREKVALNNKHVNEVDPNMNNLLNVKDEIYENQIIKKIL